MTLVKFQKVMNSELAKRTFISRPPEPPQEYLMNDPTESLFIGITKIFGTPFTWTFENLTNPHIAVVGITGAGKSFFVKTFLLRASYIWNTNAIIIDWAGEYKAWVKQSGGRVVSLAKGDYMNLMDLSGMKPIDRVKQIVSSLEILTDISQYPEQRRLTEEGIEQAYVNAGFRLAEVPDAAADPPTLKDVIFLLQEKMQEGTYEYPAELENAIYRLRQFAREGEDYFAKKSTVDLGSLASSGLVALDLSGLPDERFRALAALFVLQSMKEKMRMEGWSSSKGLKAIIVLDEAWKVASDERSDAVMIVREGRKYQFGLIVASQNPTDINEAIFSNVGTTIILRVKFEKFLNYLQGSLNFSGFIRSEVAKFGVGQAAVDMSFQTSVQFPEVFIVDRIVGEMPLNIYTITIGDVLNQNELSDQGLQKEFSFEKNALKSIMIEANISSAAINGLFAALDQKNRIGDVRLAVQILIKNNIDKKIIINFLREISISDSVISRLFV
jgi:DNA helicase HerA-like ATPase